jgi:hypothetical protein
VAFIKNNHSRFRREIAANCHMPFGATKACWEGIENADLEKLAKLVEIVGVLLQTKVYLFWNQC